VRTFLFPILLSFLGLMPISLQAFEIQPTPSGWENGNAGDAFSSEFILTGRDILQRLELLVENNAPLYDTNNLRIAVRTTEVVSEEHVFLNGQERDAVNYYPDKRVIKMNRSRWRELRRSTETRARLRLVLHEYLWISGVDDTNYTLSERLIELMKVNNYSPNIWWNPVNPTNYVIPTLTYAPEGCAFQQARFDLRKNDEKLELVTQGACGKDFRQLEIIKSTGITPPASNVRGYFHKYEIFVFDKDRNPMGSMIFEPEWGQCLLPESGTCRVSGKMTIGGVNLVFWYLRD